MDHSIVCLRFDVEVSRNRSIVNDVFHDITLGKLHSFIISVLAD